MKEPDLTGLVSTRSQAVDFNQRLTNVSQEIYEVDFNLEKSLQNNFGVKKKDKLLTLLRESEIPIDSNSDIRKFFENIKEIVSNMPEVSIIMAVQPTDEILSSISNWFALNLKHQVLIDPKIKPELIGGAVVNFEGKLFDASIKKEFDLLFDQQPEDTDNKRVQKTEEENPDQ